MKGRDEATEKEIIQQVEIQKPLYQVLEETNSAVGQDNQIFKSSHGYQIPKQISEAEADQQTKEGTKMEIQEKPKISEAKKDKKEYKVKF